MQVGIVGCGAIADIHVRALEQLPEVTLVGVADSEYQRAKALANRCGANAYGSLKELLDGEKLDTLHICTPHVLHAGMAAVAAEKDIAVFTEKPPAITPAQWEELRALARRVPVGICFQNRYNKSIRFIRDLLRYTKPGDLLGGRAFVTWSRSHEYYTESGWRGRWETEGGGVLINQAIHTVDLLVYLLGRPTLVDAAMQNFHLRGHIEVEDTVEARLLFPSAPSRFENAPVLLYATTAYCTDAPILLELVYKEATLRLEGEAVTVFRDGQAPDRHDFTPETTSGKAYWGNSHCACITDFYRSLSVGDPPPIGVEQTKNTMELVLGMYASAGDGVPRLL